jgi:hypothetical protein
VRAIPRTNSEYGRQRLRGRERFTADRSSADGARTSCQTRVRVRLGRGISGKRTVCSGAHAAPKGRVTKKLFRSDRSVHAPSHPGAAVEDANPVHFECDLLGLHSLVSNLSHGDEVPTAPGEMPAIRAVSQQQSLKRLFAIAWTRSKAVRWSLPHIQ